MWSFGLRRLCDCEDGSGQSNMHTSGENGVLETFKQDAQDAIWNSRTPSSEGRRAQKEIATGPERGIASKSSLLKAAASERES